mgnify:CR=1 FL=1|tara:strand:- start:543 stop:1727 length:1185 start_codon:yes stop_codon:yes gene_type:complete
MTDKGLSFELVLFLVGLIFASSSFADNPSIEEMNSLLAEEKHELEALKLRIKERGKKLSSVQAKERSILKTLSHLENRVKLKKRELEIYKWNIKISIGKIKKIRRNVKEAERLLEKRKSDLANWLRSMYKEGGVFSVKVMFSAQDAADLLQRIRFMQLVAEYDVRIFQDYESKYNRLLKEKEALLQVRSNLLLLKKDAENKKNDFTEEKNKRRGFLRRIKREKSFGVKLRKELIDVSRSLDKIISEQRKRLDEGKAFNISDYKGRLNYPVKGKVLSHFGKKRDRRYDSYIVHNGIIIKTPQNTPVRALYSGHVLYTGFLDGYGNLVILGHGSEFHSVYGHLDKFLIKTGQMVRKDQVIAQSGDSGAIMSTSLYFELRKNGKAIDPTSWFRTVKK